MKDTLETKIKILNQERRLSLEQLSQLDAETGRIKTLLIENQGALKLAQDLLASLPKEEDKPKKKGKKDAI